jgi:NAD-dependent dihydropyrimidine dehydrogenase PreA subunit
MLEVLNDICEGHGKPEDLEILEEVAEAVHKGSLCGLGQTAPNPVQTTLRYFDSEYKAHIIDKKCPAGVCKPLFHYEIDSEKCNGCTVCARKCPAQAVTGEKKEPHLILQKKCTKCGACYESCKFQAVVIH